MIPKERSEVPGPWAVLPREHVAQLQAERDRYRKALVAIADSESGVWGKWASAALREKDAA